MNIVYFGIDPLLILDMLELLLLNGIPHVQLTLLGVLEDILDGLGVGINLLSLAVHTDQFLVDVKFIIRQLPLELVQFVVDVFSHLPLLYFHVHNFVLDFVEF